MGKLAGGDEPNGHLKNTICRVEWLKMFGRETARREGLCGGAGKEMASRAVEKGQKERMCEVLSTGLRKKTHSHTAPFPFCLIFLCMYIYV